MKEGKLGLIHTCLAALFTGVTASAQIVCVENPNPEATPGDRFGYSVSGVGLDKVLVGSWGQDFPAPAGGAAFLYNLSGNVLTVITNHDAGEFDTFGFSVAGVGADRVIIGARGVSNFVGAAYLFDLQGQRLTTFSNPNPEAGDQFGYSVTSVGTDKVLIGTINGQVSIPNSGTAYLFDLHGNLLRTFQDPGGHSDEGFGSAVAAVGTDKVLISAPKFGRVPPLQHGRVLLFDLEGHLLAIFEKPAPKSADYFGEAISAVGMDKVLIGAPYDDDFGPENAGAAYLFNLSGELLTNYCSPSPRAQDEFGTALTGVGTDSVVIGAYRKSVTKEACGGAYLFDLNSKLLRTYTSPTPVYYGWFGGSLAALGDDKVIIGADGDEGVVYVYSTIDLPPIARCKNIRVPTDPGLRSAEVAPTALDAKSTSPMGDPLTFRLDPPGPFPRGTHSVSLVVSDASGGSDTCRVKVIVVDLEPPQVLVINGRYLEDKHKPSKGGHDKKGDDSNGFYQLIAEDNCDPNPKLFVKDSKSTFQAGPFASRSTVKITKSPGRAKMQRMGGDVVAHILLQGDALVFARDAFGNDSQPIKISLSPRKK